jgi:repressor of nif and glnA expression
MTNYTGAVKDGNGQIGASFREIPIGTEKKVLPVVKKLDKLGLGGFLKIGWAGQSLLGVPINEGRVGMILIGGLNPMAILEEAGFDVQSKASSALLDFEKLFSFENLEQQARKILK